MGTKSRMELVEENKSQNFVCRKAQEKLRTKKAVKFYSELFISAMQKIKQI